MIRFGVAVRLLGRGAPRQPRGGHLSVGLLWLQEVLRYLKAREIFCYRLPDDLLGLQAGRMVERTLESCAGLAEQVRLSAAGVRLTMHLLPGLGPAAEDQQQGGRWEAAVAQRALLLDALGGPWSVLVSHVGGAHGGKQAALERCARRVERLPEHARARLVFEPDEDIFGIADLLWLYERCGVPVVLDTLHHQIHNQRAIPLAEALGLALATWPATIRPKIHISTQRTEAHLLADGPGPLRVVPPRPGQHADFLNPHEVAALIRAARGLGPFDVMLEAKAADLALLRLREDLRRYAPELGAAVC